jgi:hypothetical protein
VHERAGDRAFRAAVGGQFDHQRERQPVAIYLSALSSGLVAIGIASSSPRALAALAFTVLPTVFVLGWFTVVRLTDTSVANIVSLRRMELIRATARR